MSERVSAYIDNRINGLVDEHNKLIKARKGVGYSANDKMWIYSSWEVIKELEKVKGVMG